MAAYPLSWPAGFPRAQRREKGAFKTTLAGALNNVETSLRLFGKDSGKLVSGVVRSSNVTLGAERPTDPGVAVYFTWEGLQVCIPVDRYGIMAQVPVTKAGACAGSADLEGENLSSGGAP